MKKIYYNLLIHISLPILLKIVGGKIRPLYFYVELKKGYMTSDISVLQHFKTKYAFVDEFGAFGFDFEKEGCTTHFIITAIIVDEDDLENVSIKLETIRRRYFQSGEIKSSKIGKKHQRRIAILNDIKDLPFHIFSFVCDKEKIFENSGLRFKKTFYKFLNDLVYAELRTYFTSLVISADEIGANDYLKSFANYIRSKEKPLTLFDQCTFRFANSKHNNIIQIADLISGSLAYKYDKKMSKKIDNIDYQELLFDKIFRIDYFPKDFDSFMVPEKDLKPDYNPLIANLCYRKAKSFIDDYSLSDNDETKQQLIVLKYLLFRFMNRSARNYIPTPEIIRQLNYCGYSNINTRYFRNKIIAKLRDRDVIISSCHDGYKIPSTEKDLYAFVNHERRIIEPMLSRLMRCNDIIKMGTNGEIVLLSDPKYNVLSTIIKQQQLTYD